MRFSKQQFIEARKKLPPEVQEILGSDERTEVYQRILKDFNLTVDEGRRLSEEAAPVIFGLVQPADFTKNLRAALPVLPQDKFTELVQRIDTQLFAPIRFAVLKKLRETHQQQGIRQEIPPVIQPQPTTPTAGSAQPPAADFAKKKLEQAFSIPSETTKITPQPGEAKKYPDVDPYREPTQ